MELLKTVRLLDKAKQNAIEQMGEAIGLAADAGDILLSARQEGLDLEAIQTHAQINGEQARRYERVAKSRPSLQAPSPSGLKQLALWTGLLPDPIETSNPRGETAWHAYIVKARQWLARKNVRAWSLSQKEQFLEEAKPIVDAYLEAGGKLNNT